MIHLAVAAGKRAFYTTPLKALSGGERNRVLLAKLFSKPSNLLVLDEPTSMLDPISRKQVFDVLARLKQEQHSTIIVIEHNLDVIKTADWIIDLGPEGGARGGRIVAEGTPEQVAAVPESATGEYLAHVLKGEPVIPLSDVEVGRPARSRTPRRSRKRATSAA